MKTLIEDLRRRSSESRAIYGEDAYSLTMDKAADALASIDGKTTAQTKVRWYCVDKEGVAILCKDKAEAECKAKDLDMWRPQNAPHRAGQLVEATEKPYDQSALEFCPVCYWNAVIPGEPCLVCERNAKMVQPESEPVAWIVCFTVDGTNIKDKLLAWTEDEVKKQVREDLIQGVVPLYASPQGVNDYVPLTDAQIIKIAKDNVAADPGRDGYILPITFARAIEKAVRDQS